MDYKFENFDQTLSWISSFVKSDQGSEIEWRQYDTIIKQFGLSKTNESISCNHMAALRNILKPVIASNKTIQGHIYLKPHGYAGDYELIDKFYTFHQSEDATMAKWDIYLQNFPAAKAVRNRKEYIKTILREKCQAAGNDSTFEMLNLASGPARDLYEFFVENPNARLNIDCIELDNNAIQYAQSLLGTHNSQVNFINKNIFRFKTDKKYDLVWSAGLFDYFNDDIFKKLLSRFIQNVKPGGEIIIGNFCTSNPNIEYMEMLDWILNHRNADHLSSLVEEIGISKDKFTIEKEPEGVNLFIRIRV